MTHCHADHMCGLKACHGHSLYCSQVSANILAKRGLGSIAKPINHAFDIIDRRSSKVLRITFIDANHCPGAVMVVIEDPEEGNCVHTGDFRMCDAIRHNNTLVRLAGNVQHLYLDATFNVPWLPSKADSIVMLEELLHENHDRDIILHSHCLGDEELLEAIFNIMRDRRVVWWNQDRRKLFECTHPHLLRQRERCRTPRCTSGMFVHIVKNTAERHRHQLAGVEISCSTLWFKHQGFENFEMNKPVYEAEKDLWHVPFSMHSSTQELLELKSLLQASGSITTWMHGNQQKKPEVRTTLFDPDTESADGGAKKEALQREADFIKRVYEAVDKSVDFYSAVDAASEEEMDELLVEQALHSPRHKRRREMCAAES